MRFLLAAVALAGGCDEAGEPVCEVAPAPWIGICVDLTADPSEGLDASPGDEPVLQGTVEAGYGCSGLGIGTSRVYGEIEDPEGRRWRLSVGTGHAVPPPQIAEPVEVRGGQYDAFEGGSAMEILVGDRDLQLAAVWVRRDTPLPNGVTLRRNEPCPSPCPRSLRLIIGADDVTLEPGVPVELGGFTWIQDGRCPRTTLLYFRSDPDDDTLDTQSLWGNYCDGLAKGDACEIRRRDRDPMAGTCYELSAGLECRQSAPRAVLLAECEGKQERDPCLDEERRCLQVGEELGCFTDAEELAACDGLMEGDDCGGGEDLQRCWTSTAGTLVCRYVE